MDDRLDSIPLLAALNNGARGEFTRRAQLRSFAPGEVLWTVDSPSRGLYVVIEGKVRILQTRLGRQHLVHTAGPGSTMGEVPLFDGRGYPAMAIAAAATECVVIAKEDLRSVLEHDPTLAWVLLEGLSARTRQLVARLQHNTLGTVRARIAASLIGLATESGDTVAHIPATQAQWAEDLGTVREVLARELRALKADGVIEQTARGRFEILRENRLEAMALELEGL